MKRHAMLTVFGKDRPGIIAGVSGILFRCGCNLEDISMTVLEGELAMMMVVGFEKSSGKRIEDALHRGLEQKMKFVCHWRELARGLSRGEKHSRNSETYLVTCAGKDRTGIVYQISRLMAKYGLNICDLNCKILGYGAKSIYTMLLEVDVPRAFSIPKLQRELRRLARTLRISIQLKPLDRIQL